MTKVPSKVLRVLSKVLIGSCLLLTALLARSEALPVVRASILQFGTVHWELAAMVEEGLDRQNGFTLTIDTRANLSASRLALTANQADVIVSDWLWAMERHSAGSGKLFMPYSASIGSLIVRSDSGIRTLADLAGRRIGVAGGPDSKGWILLQAAARKEGLDMSLDQVQFAAPPLLNPALERGQIDALLTYWHYGAKLLATGGFAEPLAMTDLAESLGLNPKMPMLGYVFNRDWAQDHAPEVANFAAAVAATKARLMTADEPWDRIRTLMRADDEALFQAYIHGYRAGHPGELALTDTQIDSAQSLYQLIRQQMPSPDQGPPSLPADLFYQGPQ